MPCRISRELKTLSVRALSLAISGCIGTGGIAPQGQVLNANTLATAEAIQNAVQDAHWPTATGWKAYHYPPLTR
ncbi:RND transporter, partial [Corynebacterium propinquum]